LIESLYALERIGELLDDPDILSKDVRNYPPLKLAGHGVGVVEAPRGTLFHEYWTDDDGLLTRVNLLVARATTTGDEHCSRPGSQAVHQR